MPEEKNDDLDFLVVEAGELPSAVHQHWAIICKHCFSTVALCEAEDEARKLVKDLTEIYGRLK